MGNSLLPEPHVAGGPNPLTLSDTTKAAMCTHWLDDTGSNSLYTDTQPLPWTTQTPMHAVGLCVSTATDAPPPPTTGVRAT
jgi:hypothetical protein